MVGKFNGHSVIAQCFRPESSPFHSQRAAGGCCWRPLLEAAAGTWRPLPEAAPGVRCWSVLGAAAGTWRPLLEVTAGGRCWRPLLDGPRTVDPLGQRVREACSHLAPFLVASFQFRKRHLLNNTTRHTARQRGGESGDEGRDCGAAGLFCPAARNTPRAPLATPPPRDAATPGSLPPAACGNMIHHSPLPCRALPRRSYEAVL